MTDDNSFIGKQIGNYHILAELNSGSFGTVYKGKHIIFEDDPIVAIKLLHAHLRSAQERNQFFQEARLLKKLTHRSILHIIDAGIQDGLPYIVTDYASGGSLQDRLRQHPHQPLPIEETLTILKQVGQALHYAHQQSIVHRDLKPGNILFNGKGEALLADFGIAIVLEKTKRIDVIGTPSYMAPEQFHGEVSQKSDQYALGCIAYELLTGQKAFTAPHGLAVGFKHLNEYPIAPTLINPAIPAHVEQAVFKALVKQRSDRHTDVSTFINALQKTSKQWSEEGKTLLDLKRYEEALAAYNQAIRLDPNDAGAYHNKGIALEHLEKKQEAQQANNRARQLGYHG